MRRCIVRLSILAIFLFMPAALYAISPAEFVLTDYLDRTWDKELVSYQVNFEQADKARENQMTLRLVSTGEAVQMQISNASYYPDGNLKSATVTFLATVPKLTRRVYRLELSPNSGFRTDLFQEKTGNTLLIGNALAAFEIPWGTNAASSGRSAAGTFPGPILRVKGPDGVWRGRGTLETELAFKGFESTELAKGPLFWEGLLEYRFEEGRYCRVKLRLETGRPYLLVSSEHNLDKESEFWFDVNPNFQPDFTAWNLGRQRWNIGDSPLMTRGKVKFTGNLGADIISIRSYLWTVMPVAQWIGTYHESGSVRDFIGVFRRDVGAWREPFRNEISLRNMDGRLYFRFPLESGAHHYGFYVGEREKAARQPTVNKPSDIHYWMARADEIALDRIKDWVLGKGEPVQVAELGSPGAQQQAKSSAQAADLTSLRQRHNSLTDAARRLQDPALQEELRRMLGQVQSVYRNQGAAAASELMDQIEGKLPSQAIPAGRADGAAGEIYEIADLILDFGSQTALNPSRDVRRLVSFALTHKSRLENREHQAINARLLLCAYLLNSRGYYPSEALRLPEHHPESLNLFYPRYLPNMKMDIYCAVALIGNSIPDHPMSDAWLEFGNRETGLLLAEAFYDSGGFEESITYAHHTLQTNIALIRILKAKGKSNYFQHPHFKAFLDFMIKTQCPDGTTNGSGDNNPTRSYYVDLFSQCIDEYKETDPALAGRMAYAMARAGASDTHGVKPVKPDLKSEVLFPKGVILRADYGEPTETYLWLTTGPTYSHRHRDEGSFQLYGLGQRLSADGGHFAEAWDDWRHNVTLFGGRYAHWGEEEQRFLAGQYLHGGGQITRFHTTDAADLVTTQIPDSRAISYARRLYFVKNRYLLLLDDINSYHAATAYLHGVGERVAVQGSRVDFLYDAPDRKVDFSITRLTNTNQRLETGVNNLNLHNSGNYVYRQRYIKTVFAPNENPFWLLDFRPSSQQPLKAEALSTPGGVKIASADGSVDYVFLGGQKVIEYNRDGVIFRGTAGSIHKQEDTLTLCLFEGDRIGFGDIVFTAESGLKRGRSVLKLKLYGKGFEGRGFKGVAETGFIPRF